MNPVTELFTWINARPALNFACILIDQTTLYYAVHRAVLYRLKPHNRLIVWVVGCVFTEEFFHFLKSL